MAQLPQLMLTRRKRRRVKSFIRANWLPLLLLALMGLLVMFIKLFA